MTEVNKAIAIATDNDLSLAIDKFIATSNEQ